MSDQIAKQLQKAFSAELATLNRITHAIGTATHNPQDLAALIATEVARLVTCDYFQITLFIGDQCEFLYPISSQDLVDCAIDPLCLTSTTHYITDLTTHTPPFPLNPATPLNFTPRSILLLPLLDNAEVIGSITLCNQAAHAFSQNQIRQLEIITNQAATAFSNALLHEEEELLTSDIEMISSIARQVNALASSEEIFHQVVNFAHHQLDLHLVMILTVNPNTGKAVTRFTSHPDFTPGMQLGEFSSGLIGSAMRGKCTVVVNDVSQDSRYIPGVGLAGYEDIAERTTSEVVIPLLAKSELIGVIDFQNDHPEGFSERQVRVLEALAQEVAGAIDRASELDAQREWAWLTRAQFAVAKTISSSDHRYIDKMLKSVTALSHMLLGARQCAFLRLEENGEGYIFRPISINGATKKEHTRFLQQSIPMGAWGTLDAVTIGQEMRSSSQSLPWFRPKSATPIELYPLFTRETIHGVFIIEPTQQTHLIERQRNRKQELLTSILRQLTDSIERKKLRTAQLAESWRNTALLQVAQAMNNLIDLDKMLNTVVRLVSMLIGVEYCFLLITDEAANTLRPGPSYGLPEASYQILTNLEAYKLDSQKFLHEIPTASNSTTALHTVPLPSKLAAELGIAAVRVVPLRARNKIVGLLAIGNSINGEPLRGRRFGLLADIAQQAAIAVVNDQLYKESAETERLQQELDVAFSIQTSLLPNGSPTIPGLSVASYWEAARQVSGDFYDFLQLPDGNWGIVIADVAGKGVPAALYMALSRTIIRAVGFTRVDPAKILTRVNQIIWNDTRSDLFVTVFFAIWNPQNGHLRYANGGHNRPLILRADGDVQEIGEYGIALGVLEEVPLAVQEITVQIGDSIIFYTDGVTEAMNKKHETLGLNRITQLLQNDPPKTPQATIHAIRAAVQTHSAGAAQSDDMTMVVIRREKQ